MRFWHRLFGKGHMDIEDPTARKTAEQKDEALREAERDIIARENRWRELEAELSLSKFIQDEEFRGHNNRPD